MIVARALEALFREAERDLREDSVQVSSFLEVKAKQIIIQPKEGETPPSRFQTGVGQGWGMNLRILSVLPSAEKVLPQKF